MKLLLQKILRLRFLIWLQWFRKKDLLKILKLELNKKLKIIKVEIAYRSV
jgi:hypothetical protein